MAHFCETWNSPVDKFNDPQWDTGWIERQGGFNIVGQQLHPASCNFPNRMEWFGSTDTDDQVVSFIVVSLAGTAFGGWPNAVSACLRVHSFISPDKQYYLCTIFQFAGDGWLAEIAKFVSNTFFSITTTVLDSAPTGKRLKGRVTGSLIELLIDDVVVLSTTDTDIPTGNKVGIEINQPCGTPFGNLIIDTCFGGDVADQDLECQCLGNCPEPPAPTFTLGRPADCGHAFLANPCPKLCPERAFVMAGTTTLDLAHAPMGFPSPLLPFSLVTGRAARQTVRRPTNCGHAFMSQPCSGGCRER